MSNCSKLLHIDFIKSILEKPIKEEGILTVGNNLNDYFSFQKVEDYANNLKKQGDDRVQKSSKDPIMGRVVEELIIYLLDNYFSHNKINYFISNGNINKDVVITHYLYTLFIDKPKNKITT